jgi:hypothetical protein
VITYWRAYTLENLGFSFDRGELAAACPTLRTVRDEGILGSFPELSHCYRCGHSNAPEPHYQFLSYRLLYSIVPRILSFFVTPQYQPVCHGRPRLRGLPRAFFSKNLRFSLRSATNSELTAAFSPLSPIVPAPTRNRGEGVFRGPTFKFHLKCRRADIPFSQERKDPRGLA